jgi:hypothetical protein
MLDDGQSAPKHLARFLMFNFKTLYFIGGNKDE